MKNTSFESQTDEMVLVNSAIELARQEKYPEATSRLMNVLKKRFIWFAVGALVYIQFYRYRIALSIILGILLVATGFIDTPLKLYFIGVGDLYILIFSLASFVVGLKRQAIQMIVIGIAISLLLLL